MTTFLATFVIYCKRASKLFAFFIMRLLQRNIFTYLKYFLRCLGTLTSDTLQRPVFCTSRFRMRREPIRFRKKPLLRSLIDDRILSEADRTQFNALSEDVASAFRCGWKLWRESDRRGWLIAAIGRSIELSRLLLRLFGDAEVRDSNSARKYNRLSYLLASAPTVLFAE